MACCIRNQQSGSQTVARVKMDYGPTLGVGALIRLHVLIIRGSFARSFMFELLWLVFSVSFGLCGLVFYLQLLNDPQSAINAELRLDQLLPLVGAAHAVLGRRLLH